MGSDRDRVLAYLLSKGLAIDSAKVDVVDPRGYWTRSLSHGDLVFCFTRQAMDRWKFAYLLEMQDPSGPYRLRAIGETRTCWMHNETLYALRGGTHPHTLDGYQWEAFSRVRSACQEAYRIRGVEAPVLVDAVFSNRDTSEGTFLFSSRQHSWDRLYRWRIPGAHKLTVKKIVKTLEELTPNGWGELSP